jgi:hypothetical protein
LSLMMKTSHSCFQKKIQMELWIIKKNCVTCHAINKIEETWVPN